MESGLVLQGGEQVQIWDPATMQTTRSLLPGAVVAGPAVPVVWRAGSYAAEALRALHFTDAVSGAEQLRYGGSVTAGYGYGPGVLPFGAAFSPDGRTLAVAGQEVVPGDRGAVRAVLVLVDVETGTVRRVTSERSQSSGPVAWSASGEWVFVAPIDGEGASTLMAYRLGSNALVELRRPPSSDPVLALVAGWRTRDLGPRRRRGVAP